MSSEREVGLIRTARLVLEPLRPDHATELGPLLADPVLHEFIGGSPASVDELRARYERQAAGRNAAGDELWFNWIARVSSPAGADRAADGAAGPAVGYVQATVIGDGAELAWVIGLPYQRQGFAREAALGMVGWLRSTGVRRFTAHIAPDHAASAAVARALGLSATDAVVDGETVWRS